MYQSSYELNFVPGGVPRTIHISQYDVGLRQFHFTPIAVPGQMGTVSGAVATLEATKPDGNAVVQSCTYNNDGTIDYVVQEQLAAVAGKVWSKIVLRSGADVIGAAAIVWMVDRAGVADDASLSDSDISGMQSYVNQLTTMVSKPIPVTAAAQMTDHNQLYVYEGSESGYVAGNWYWYNGTAWVSGGQYGGSVEVDPTLSIAGEAADAKATGDGLAELKTELGNKSNLNTDTKTNLVAAINEVNGHFLDGISEGVSAWLAAHPEATTTVQDNSLTSEKLVPSLQETISNSENITNTVAENNGIDDTITESDAYKVYTGKTYTITSPIVLTDRDKLFNKVISNSVFVLYSTMFTWTERWMPIPDFVNCVFIGNGNYIVDENLYCTKSKFVNCIFYNCGIINNGDELQSVRFLHCRFVGTTNLIKAKILNDFEMDSCQFENDFQACIVDTSSYDKGGLTSVQSFRVLNTIMEGQSAQTSVLFKISQGGQVFFDKCYFEQVMCGLLDLVVPQNAPTNPMLILAVTNCKFSMGRRPFININSYYENGNRVYVDISNNQLTETQDNTFISTDVFKHLTIQNNIIGSSSIKIENQKSVSDLATETDALANRLNVKVIDAWVDGTLNADTDDTISNYGAQLGEFFNKFAYEDRLKYTNTISFVVVEKGKDSNGNDPVNGVWLRQRLYGNTGYADYLEVLQTSNNAMVTSGKYKIRIAYTD